MQLLFQQSSRLRGKSFAFVINGAARGRERGGHGFPGCLWTIEVISIPGDALVPINLFGEPLPYDMFTIPEMSHTRVGHVVAIPHCPAVLPKHWQPNCIHAQ